MQGGGFSCIIYGYRWHKCAGLLRSISVPILCFLCFKVFMSRNIALTGGIACGKSMAERCFAQCGCRVLDADAVVHDLEAPGGEAVEPIVARFGRGVLDGSGGIDHAQLARCVFADGEARKALEQIVHPLVRQKARAWLETLKPGDLALFSAALLFECGWAEAWSEIVCVVASEATQLRRMMRVRGLSEADAKARLASQMPVAEKAKRSTWVLENDCDDLPALSAQVERLVAQWRANPK